MTEIVLKSLVIYGIVIVVSMMTAILIRIIVVALGKMEQSASTTQPVAPLPKQVHADGIAPDVVAAISAAVRMMEGDFRIVHIEDHHKGTGWVAEGRNAHHASHAFEHNPRQADSTGPRFVKR